MPGLRRLPPGRGPLSHAQARALLAERIDGPLTPDREAALEAHLAACPGCRLVEGEYLANRAALRHLAAPAPPRDLPARTLAALELEAAHDRSPQAGPVLRSGRAPHLRGARRSGSVAFGSLLTVALVAVVGALLVGPGVPVPGPAVGATPFAIAPVNLAFVAMQGDVLRLYRTRLDRACPAGSVSCVEFGPQADQVVGLPQGGAVSGLALDPVGRRAAIAARSTINATTTYYVVDLNSGSAGAPSSTGASEPPVGGATASPSPSPSPRHSGTARATTGAARTRSAPLTGQATTTAPHPTAATRTPRTTSTPAATHRVTASSSTPEHPAPSRPPTASSPGLLGEPAASSASSAPGTPQTSGASPGVPSGAPSGSAGSSALAGVQALPPVQAQPILQDVVSTGASPAWSPDGSTLAFSAMPADGTLGSDIYIWHPDDAWAVAVTSDHASTFASWAGDRIVGSTLIAAPDDPEMLTPQTFVLDPRTGERRTVEGARLWLPSVDPTGRFAVGWSGTLRLVGQVPVPSQGQLVFTPWSSLDPFALPAPTPAAMLTPSLSMPSGSPRSARVRAEATSLASAAPSTLLPTDAPAPASAAATSQGAATPLLAPVDPTPAPGGSASTIQDWVVAWSPDGSAFAVWEGPSLGVDAGSLTVHAVDTTMGQPAPGPLLLGPLSAQRAFSMGLDRLAWTTPTDLRGYCQLRVAVWGAFGTGELRSLELDQQGVVPAF
ncbi:MAG: TolB family protein [Candidatus Limnocylindrales bacterium]